MNLSLVLQRLTFVLIINLYRVSFGRELSTIDLTSVGFSGFVIVFVCTVWITLRAPDKGRV